MSKASRRASIVDVNDDAGYTPVCSACSAEPMARPDHKAKSHGRPMGRSRVRWQKREARA